MINCLYIEMFLVCRKNMFQVAIIFQAVTIESDSSECINAIIVFFFLIFELMKQTLFKCAWNNLYFKKDVTG